MKIVVKLPVKPRQGHPCAQTGAGAHKSARDYRRKPKHPHKEQ